MTDIELLDKFCEECLEHISPYIFREIEKRGLTGYVNYLPPKTAEAKAVVRARLSRNGKYIGEPEIEQIAFVVSRLEKLRDTLQNLSMTDAHKTLPVIEEMKELTIFLNDFFKPVRKIW